MKFFWSGKSKLLKNSVFVFILCSTSNEYQRAINLNLSTMFNNLLLWTSKRSERKTRTRDYMKQVY